MSSELVPSNLGELTPRSAGDIILRPNYPVGRQQRRETHTIWGAQIIFRNFSGRAGEYNAEGVRGFSVLLDEELAHTLIAAGLNVKPLRLQEEDTEQMYHLAVAVSYKVRPPRVYMVTGDGSEGSPLRKTMLDESLVGMMDTLELSECNLIISISNYEVRGTKGKKAYLQSFFGHVLLDELEERYATVEDMVLQDTAEHLVSDMVIDGEIV